MFTHEINESRSRITARADSVGDLYEFLSSYYGGIDQLLADDFEKYSCGMDTDMKPHETIEAMKAGGYTPRLANALPRAELPASATQSLSAIKAPTLGTSPVGFAPVVPNAIIGQPDAMLSFDQEAPQKKLIRIGIATGRGATVTPKAVENRGRALMAVIERMTEVGYSVELTARWFQEDTQGKSRIFDVTIKEAHEHYSPASVAFGLASTSLQRHAIWTLDHTLSYMHQVKPLKNGGMAQTKNEEFDLYIKPIFDNYQFNTQAQAVKNIVNLINPIITNN